MAPAQETSSASNPLDSTTLSLGALMSGVSESEYAQSHQELLANLEKIEHPFPIKTEENYRLARSIKYTLSGLYCYTFNNKHPDFDRVSEAESRWGQALAKYNRKLLIKDSETKSVARYLLWGRYYPMVNLRAVLDEANAKGILRRGRDSQGNPTDTLLVIGLEMKVGDNMFSVDHRGREHRQYCKTIGRQSFPVQQQYKNEIDQAFMDTVPTVDETYTETYLGDAKHVARPIGLRYQERNSILERFS